MNANVKFDVTIIGAGMVGLALANLLGNSQLRVAVIDKKLPPIDFDNSETDIRVSAITLASQQLLQQIGAWQHIPQTKLSPFRCMQVWDAIGTGRIEFNSKEIAESELGYILENRVLQSALFQQLKKHANVEFIVPAELKEISTGNAIIIEPQQILLTQLLIGADGAESKVRQLAELEAQTYSYGHSALVANVRTSLPHQQTAWQRFLPKGPLAFLPLPDPHCCSIVWSTVPAEIEQLHKLCDEEFKPKLAAAFAHRLGSIEEVSSRAIFPLQMRHAKNYVKPQLALIGDAAHTIHPLAGQGVNLGFQDAACLANTILTALRKNRDIGSLATLRRYERARKSENQIMITFVEMIKQLFSQESMVRTAANWGLNFTNHWPFLKNIFVRHATK